MKKEKKMNLSYKKFKIEKDKVAKWQIMKFRRKAKLFVDTVY